MKSGFLPGGRAGVGAGAGAGAGVEVDAVGATDVGVDAAGEALPGTADAAAGVEDPPRDDVEVVVDCVAVAFAELLVGVVVVVVLLLLLAPSLTPSLSLSFLPFSPLSWSMMAFHPWTSDFACDAT